MLTKQHGVRLLSSDAEVHKLYAEDKTLFEQVKKLCPQAIVNGKIDRRTLGEVVFNYPAKRQQLEDIVYPLLAKGRDKFIMKAVKDKIKILVLEIPLLFENNLDVICDKTVTLYCAPSLEKKRVMKRPGMTEEKYWNILATQLPTAEKIKHSDYHFNTGRSKEFIARAARKLYLELLY